MNTCARMESSSEPNRIQCSKETASLLIDAGKGAWIEKRTDSIHLKGLGSVEGFWVMAHGDRAGSISSSYKRPVSRVLASGTAFPELDDRTVRLVNWNTEILTRLLREVIARRPAAPRSRSSNAPGADVEFGTMPLEEVRDE